MNYFSAFFCVLGSVKFNTIATIVASTTGDFPKIVVTHSGNCARDAFACVTPIPTATASPTTVVLRKSIGSVVIMSREPRAKFGDMEMKLAVTAAGFLGRQMEG